MECADSSAHIESGGDMSPHSKLESGSLTSRFTQIKMPHLIAAIFIKLKSLTP